MDELVMMNSDHGGMAILAADKIMAALGAYGLKLSPDGTLEALIVKPDGAAWESVEDLPAVVAGQTSIPRRPRRN